MDYRGQRRKLDHSWVVQVVSCLRRERVMHGRLAMQMAEADRCQEHCVCADLGEES